jgi:tetratricopeptide (TPR) repeat protein
MHFCYGCILSWLKQSQSCPTCRREDVSILNSNNESLCEKECKDGYYLIAKAEALGFVDKQPLKDAVRHFMSAIVSNRSHPEGYIGLGYLALLISKVDLATQYLARALEISPDNADAQRLLDYIKQRNPGDQ